jgi:type II secretory pathway pseudopilin PulG
MKFLRNKIAISGKASGAFTLVEMLVSMTVLSFVFVSLFAGLSSSTGSLQRAREKLRATQILTEKLEVIRLYNWDQVTTNGFIPSTFTEYQYPTTGSGTNSFSTSTAYGNRGITYVGTISIGPAEVPNAYTNTMRKAKATIRWYSNGIQNTNEMETLISQYGVQRYVY